MLKMIDDGNQNEMNEGMISNNKANASTRVSNQFKEKTKLTHTMLLMHQTVILENKFKKFRSTEEKYYLH